MTRHLNYTLTHGEILDVGLEHYGEFIVSTSYATELLNGGMTTVNGRPGRLIVIDTFTNAVQLRWIYNDQPQARVLPQLRAVSR